MIFLILEIIFLLLFSGIIFYFIKKKKTKEIIFFVFPIILLYFFIETFWIYKGDGAYSKNFHFLIMGMPLIVPFVWVVVIFFSMWLTKKTFLRNKIIKKEKFLLSLSDAFFSVLFAFFIFEPLAYKFNLWYHIGKANFFSGAPLWYFIGWFLSVFLISFGYRTFKNLNPQKRFFLVYGYIFFIIVGRLFVYLLFGF